MVVFLALMFKINTVNPWDEFLHVVGSFLPCATLRLGSDSSLYLADIVLVKQIEHV